MFVADVLFLLFLLFMLFLLLMLFLHSVVVNQCSSEAPEAYLIVCVSGWVVGGGRWFAKVVCVKPNLGYIRLKLNCFVVELGL